MRKKIILLMSICLIVLSSLSLVVGCSGGKATSLEISNKTELAAEWHLNEYDRKIEYVVKSGDDKLSGAGVDITSSNPEAVIVIGNKIRPVGVGSAVITVSSGNVKDEINVEVTAKITRLKISNKDELSQYWMPGNADREVKITVDPDKYTSDQVGYTLVSSDTNVVAVNGKTIRAVNTGNATITAKFGDYTDSVDVYVQPPITSVTVTNKSELSQEWNVGESRKIDCAFVSPETFTEANTKVEITADDPEAIDADGYNVIPRKSGSYTLTVAVGNKSDTVDVNFKLLAPVISVSDEQTLVNAYHGTAITLPMVTAETCDGTNITTDLEVELSDPQNMVKRGARLTVAKTGMYSIKYTATDPRDENVKTEKVISINVARKIINDDNDGGIKSDFKYVEDCEFVKDEQQKLTTTHTGFSWLKFNIEPSKLYYAEVTYDYTAHTNLNNAFLYGMAHYLEGLSNKRWVATCMDGGTGANQNNFYIRDFVSESSQGGGWAIAGAGVDFDSSPSFYSYSPSTFRGIPFDNSEKSFTFGIARDGDMFYSFVNGAFMGAVSYEFYRNKDTIPGIFGEHFSYGGVNGCIMSNIKFYGGDEARDTIQKLLYENETQYGHFQPFTFWGTKEGYGESKDTFKTSVRTNKPSAERGMNFDYVSSNDDYYHSSVSPHVYFEKDFTFEWTYKKTNATSANAMMQLQVRNRKCEESLLQFGAMFNNNTSSALFYRDRADTVCNMVDNPTEDNFVKYFDGVLDDSQGLRFKVTRKIGESSATYTISAYSIANPSQKMTKSFEYNGTGVENRVAKWYQGVVIMWNNDHVAGEFSNIRWSYKAEADEPTQSATQTAVAEQVAIVDDKRTIAL